jgi:hypothetical protein
VDLGARAFDILIALASRPNEAVSKKELIAQVWPDTTVRRAACGFTSPTCGGRLAMKTTVVAPISRSDALVDERVGPLNFPHANLPSRVTHMVSRAFDRGEHLPKA